MCHKMLQRRQNDVVATLCVRCKRHRLALVVTHSGQMFVLFSITWFKVPSESFSGQRWSGSDSLMRIVYLDLHWLYTPLQGVHRSHTTAKANEKFLRIWSWSFVSNSSNTIPADLQPLFTNTKYISKISVEDWRLSEICAKLQNLSFDANVDKISLSLALNFVCNRGKKGKRTVQEVPQSQAAALPRHQKEEETDKTKEAQIKQTYEKHLDNALFPKRGNRSAKRN